MVVLSCRPFMLARYHKMRLEAFVLIVRGEYCPINEVTIYQI